MQGTENRNQTPPQGGVVIPPQTVAQSNATKAARKKTMAQLPVYRAACNLLYVIVIITKRCPKSIRKFTDQIIYDCTELIKAIGMADTSREMEMRVHYINTALVLINSIRTYIKVLELTNVLVKVRHPEPDPGKFQPTPKIEVVNLDKDLSNKLDKVTRSIVSQLIGWRDKPQGQGVNQCQTPKNGVA